MWQLSLLNTCCRVPQPSLPPGFGAWTLQAQERAERGRLLINCFEAGVGKRSCNVKWGDADKKDERPVEIWRQGWRSEGIF